MADTARIVGLQRQLDQLSPAQIAALQQRISALSPERRANLDRVAAHLATRLGRDPQTLPLTGTAYPNAHKNADGEYDGFDLQVQDRPDLSGFVTLAEWVYLSRKAAIEAIERAGIDLGIGFDSTAEVRAARDAFSDGVSASRSVR